MNKKDASIRVTQMQFKDNGTFTCDVKNPPDITGQPSATKVRVVMKGDWSWEGVTWSSSLVMWVWLTNVCFSPVESLPQTSTAVIVGGVIGAVIGIIIISVVMYLIIRRQEPSRDYEGYVYDTQWWKRIGLFRLTGRLCCVFNSCVHVSMTSKPKQENIN